jgi:hypothetical protein
LLDHLQVVIVGAMPEFFLFAERGNASFNRLRRQIGDGLGAVSFYDGARGSIRSPAFLSLHFFFRRARSIARNLAIRWTSLKGDRGSKSGFFDAQNEFSQSFHVDIMNLVITEVTAY